MDETDRTDGHRGSWPLKWTIKADGAVRSMASHLLVAVDDGKQTSNSYRMSQVVSDDYSPLPVSVVVVQLSS